MKRFFKENLNRKLILISLYFLGLLHWYLFLNFKNGTFEFLDWPVHFAFYELFEEAIKSFTIPYHVSLYSTDDFLAGITEKIPNGRFFGSEWIIFPPQIFLLLVLNAKTYLTIQYMFFYSLSFYGIMKFCKEFNLSLVSSSFLLILSTYNGRLLSQTGFGEPHFVYGLMLIPLFYWYLYSFLKREEKTRNDVIKNVLKISLIFYFILSQFEAHIFYQMCVVSFFIIIFFPKKIFSYFSGLFLSSIMSCWYLLPVIFYSDKFSGIESSGDHWRVYGIYGYGHQNGHVGKPIFEDINLDSFNFMTENIISLFQNTLKYLINIFGHIYESLTVTFNTFYHNTHEYNIYISNLGLVLVFFSILNANTSINFIKKNKKKIFFSFFLIFILSVGPTHKYIMIFLKNFYEFNIIGGVPARFMIYVFYFVIIWASTGFDLFLNKIRLKNNLLKSLLLVILIIILWNHSFEWWLYNSRIYTGEGWSVDWVQVKIYTDVIDPVYKKMVNISYLISVLSVICAIGYYLFLKKNNLLREKK